MDASTLTAPTPGYATAARVTRVIDGDTVEVTISKTVTVRLLDCWAPEARGLGKAPGLAAKAFLEDMVKGKAVTLEVPTEANGELSGLFTFGRVLGRLWLKGQNVAAAMVAAGKATAKKSG